MRSRTRGKTPRSNDTEPGTYEIKKIFVETSNPINEYRVQIKKV